MNINEPADKLICLVSKLFIKIHQDSEFMLTNFKNKFLKVDKEDVIADARENGMAIDKIEDFRELKNDYELIDIMMQQYATSFARSSAIGGVTTGIRGFVSSLTYAGIDTALLSLQLYRLAQRYAILNGFDINHPLHKKKIMHIYYETLGVNAAAQAVLKKIFTSVNAKDEEQESEGSSVRNAITKLVKLYGKRTYSRKVLFTSKSLLVPVIGGIAGVAVSYGIAKKTSALMQKSYKQAYFEHWQ